MYLIFGVSEGETLVDAMLNALEYSIMTFTGVGNSDSLPSNPFMRILVFAQSFAGVLFSVLLGYILGTREQP